MRSKLLTLIYLLATALSPNAAWAQNGIVKVFEFSEDGVLPSADSEIELFTAGATAPEADVFSVSGGLLQQRTFGVSGNYSYSFPDASLTGGGLDPTLNLVMEARLRSNRIQGVDGAFFQAFDGVNRYGPLFDSSGDIRFVPGGSAELSISDLDQFHTYRVVSAASSNQFDFYVDGVLVFNGTAPSTSGFNGFEWGDGLSTTGNGADVDWYFVRFAQPIVSAVQEIANSQTDGPLRQDGIGGLEPFDIDGGGNDLGAVIGVGLSHSQSYAFSTLISNPDPTAQYVDLQWFESIDPIVLDSISTKFSLDPDFEDFDADGLIDGLCNDSNCDGIVADIDCPVAINEPAEGTDDGSTILLIEAGSLPAGDTCVPTIFVATQQSSGGKGHGSKSARFEPETCTVAATEEGIQVTDTFALNTGSKLFSGATNDLLSGPVGSIQLRPIGCP